MSDAPNTEDELGTDECAHFGCSRDPWQNGLCQLHVTEGRA